MLTQVKKIVLRRGVLFKTINRVECGIIDLTVQCIDSIKSTKLAKMLKVKLQISLKNGL